MSQHILRQTFIWRPGGLTGTRGGKVHLRLTISCSSTTVLSVQIDLAPGHIRETVSAYKWVMLLPHPSGGSSRSFSVFHTGIHLFYVLTCQVSDGIFDNVVPAVWLLNTCWVLHTMSPAGTKGRWQVTPQMKSGSLHLVLQLMRGFMSTLISLH